MARPIDTSKPSVNLAAAGSRGSRIRRDPPPVVKQKIVDPADSDQWTVLVGVVAFAVAFVIIIFAFGNMSGRSSEERTVELRFAD